VYFNAIEYIGEILPERHTSGNQLKGALVDFAQRNVFTDF
jgi:hypothetical protein